MVGLTLLIGRLTHTPAESRSNKNTRAVPRTKRDELKDESYSSGPQRDPRPYSSKNTSSDSQQSGVDNEYKFITDQFFNHSKNVALLFEYWQNEDFKAGTYKAAKVIHTIDKHLLKALKGDLDPEFYQAIELQLHTMEPLSRAEKKEAAKEFVNALQNGFGSDEQNTNHHQLGLFQFLDHLDIHHIVQLFT